MNDNNHLSIGIDLGGTKIEGIVAKKGTTKAISRMRIPTHAKNGYSAIVQSTAKLICDLQANQDSKLTIGIGIPGTIDSETGLIKNANTQCLIGQPFQKDLETLLKQKVAVKNDANCFALAEALQGAGKGKELVLGVIMGTGMGGGMVHKGRIWEGPNSIAGEWGHASINYQGRPCWCGRKGCLETYLSGPAIEAQYLKLSGNKKSLPEIYLSYIEKEQTALHVLTEFLEIFGEAMANLINTFDPNIIVLGGGVSNLPILYNLGIQEVEKRIFNDHLTTDIVQNKLGDSAGVWGAAFLGQK